MSLSWWCYLTISSSVTPFSFCLQSFSASSLFQWVSWLFESGGQSIGASASATVLAMNVQGWFPLGLTGLIPLQSKGLLEGKKKSLLQYHNLKGLILQHSAFFMVQLSHLYMILKNHSFDYMDLCQQSYVSAFNTLFRFVIAFLPRIKHLLISWVQSTSTVILEPRNNKICHYFCFFPFCLSWSDGTRCHDLSFLDVEF